MFINNVDYFKKKPVNIPKLAILLDSGYHPNLLTQKLKEVYPAIMTKIRFQYARKTSRHQETIHGKSSFVPQPTRWIEERSNLDGTL